MLSSMKDVSLHKAVLTTLSCIRSFQGVPLLDAGPDSHFLGFTASATFLTPSLMASAAPSVSVASLPTPDISR